MPAIAMMPPAASPTHSALSVGVLGVGRVLEGGLEEVLERVGHAGDADHAGHEREHRERRHRELHRPRALGHVVLGPGKPTSVSSGSPVIGFMRLAVVQVSALQLARLRHRLAEEDPEDHPEGVERGQQPRRGSPRSRAPRSRRRG